ncbi:MAG: 3-oxoadipyl-CoA thiolase [Saprospiraceae bacterium]|nr:3-oxoadipyl-CoA thiolase [Saprospiraceae bacterium]MCF8252917.1 3-oxoadipyl-CoA thiolase [Saprospiraceae bacterium]MCF8313781.1 3-oxoadipyl-CoA thiolase [Saprospiraceae bacterium]MCF8442487.1 3-oxoadipyl-CoA thiolase [Saprospiraceae bacterium]
MNNAYIIDAIRTPVASFQGSLSPVRADDLAAHAIAALLARHPNIPLDSYADVILGCANQAGEDNRNVARMAALLAGLPVTVPGETVNRLCASGMSAVVQASRAIHSGEGDMFIAGGVEQMTRGPLVISKASQPFGRDAEMHDSSFGWRFINPRMKALYGVDGMGNTAENLAEQHKISREDQDTFAFWSQQKAAAAQASGRLAEEISPVSIPQRKGDPVIFSEDEFIKPSTTLAVLAKLRSAFKKAEDGGTVTAGNASGLNDGAAAMLVASEIAVKKFDLKPLARIVSSGVAGVEPRIMGIGPVPASQLALDRAGLTLADMDIIELNEAFAAQALACTRTWGIADNDPRLNPNGGAIAIGHPLGMSGTRILQTAAIELHRQQKRYALATMCVGVGQGYAVVLEKV